MIIRVVKAVVMRGVTSDYCGRLRRDECVIIVDAHTIKRDIDLSMESTFSRLHHALGIWVGLLVLFNSLCANVKVKGETDRDY